MEAMARALEVTGEIDENHRLRLHAPIPLHGPRRVRVIILFPDEDDVTEGEWLRAASTNPALDFLRSPAEDIYTLEDGKPYNVEG